MNSVPAAEERRGIFGIETEHAILYIPAEGTGPGPSPRGRPPFAVIEEVLFECLLAGRKSARSSGMKGGYFLENGGLVHLEIFIRKQSDTPVLEVATPECRSPWGAMEYSRAFDEILEETSRRSRAALAEKGYRGQLAFGKNNRDPRGAGYGCHENYMVYHRPARRDRVLTLLVAPLICLSFFPAFLIFMLALIVVIASLLLFVGMAWLLGKVSIPLESWLKRVYDRYLKNRPVWLETSRALYYFVSHALLLPGIRLYSVLLRRVAFRPFFQNLTPFLASRQAITGAGYLNFREGVYELSQRATLTRSLGSIIMFGRQKTVFDLKVFLFDPLALFRRSKRLSLAVGDSNLSDIPNLLKVGTTALVVEMIEAGESFEKLRLRRPLRALKTVSAEGPWKMLPLQAGQALTAIEIQRAYLSRAREFFRDKPSDRLRHEEILRLWGETLNRLSDRPMTLNDTLDWVAKKSLLDQAILGQSSWTVFFSWGKIFHTAGLDPAMHARNLPDMIRLVPFLKRFRLRGLMEQEKVDPADFSAQRDLYFQARKLDLRFHELGADAGYQRKLEKEGFIRTLVEPEQLARAIREAPQDTRARIRGYYIQSSAAEVLNVSWNEIELRGPTRRVPTPDPFSCRLPLE